LDVGANVGLYTAYFAEHGPSATIYSFEPNPDAMQLLARATGAYPNVRRLELALGDRDAAAVSFAVPLDDVGMPVTGLSHLIDSGGTDESSFTAPMRTIDGLVSDGDVKIVPPVFLKVDVEGAELQVFRGARQFLREFRPVIFFECEAKHHSSVDVADEALRLLIEEFGYTVLEWSDGMFNQRVTVAAGATNYLAVTMNGPKKHRQTYSLTEVVDALGATPCEGPASCAS
jgi:FkbM family methyltransferase